MDYWIWENTCHVSLWENHGSVYEVYNKKLYYLLQVMQESENPALQVACFCLHHCYSCCTLTTIQMATNLWYFQYRFVLWWEHYNLNTWRLQPAVETFTFYLYNVHLVQYDITRCNLGWVSLCWVKLNRRLHSWWCPSVNFFKSQPCDHIPPGTQNFDFS